MNNEVSNKKVSIKSNEQLWVDYVDHMKTINDPIVQSLFQQAQFIRYEEGKITIECAKELILFKDRLEETRGSWQSILQKFFDDKVTLDVSFSKNNTKMNVSKKNNDYESFASQSLMPELTQKKEKLNETVTTVQQKEHVDHRYKQKTKFVVSKNELAIDVSNKNVWKISSMLLHHFPGIITEVCEN